MSRAVNPFGPLIPGPNSAPVEAPESPAPAVDAVTPADNAPEALEVPKGTTKELLAWVDGDKDRAAAALAVENESEQPRKGLVSELSELLEDDGEE